MAGHLLSVICAWCNRVVVIGPPGAPVTHTMCPSCIDWTMTHPTGRRDGGASDLEELRPTDESGSRQSRTA